jgi:hypothetical protein
MSATVSVEQRLRDALERMGVPDAQSYSAGSLVELANMANARASAIEQCAGILLGEVGRLRKLQLREFRGSRDAQIAKLFSMAGRLRKLK